MVLRCIPILLKSFGGGVGESHESSLLILPKSKRICFMGFRFFGEGVLYELLLPSGLLYLALVLLTKAGFNSEVNVSGCLDTAPEEPVSNACEEMPSVAGLLLLDCMFALFCSIVILIEAARK